MTQHGLLQQSIKRSLSFDDYLTLHTLLVQAGSTTGSNQTETYEHYTLLNLQRIQRGMKKLEFTDMELPRLDDDHIWLVITETWCGDAGQSLAVIQKLAEVLDRVELRLVFRDNNLELMDHFLTGTSRSIPKLICLNKDTLEVQGTWGLRPQAVVDMVSAEKEEKGHLDDDFKVRLQKWYNKDKGRSIATELLDMLAIA